MREVLIMTETRILSLLEQITLADMVKWQQAQELPHKLVGV
jgi:DNA-binding IscR family transcriptional regulator